MYTRHRYGSNRMYDWIYNAFQAGKNTCTKLQHAALTIFVSVPLPKKTSNSNSTFPIVMCPPIPRLQVLT
jgi:uncharacterized membrane protein